MILGLFVLGVQQSQAYYWKLKWQSIQTPHFQIHYPEGYQEVGKLVAKTSESIHDQITAWMGWEISDKVQIVISDDVDFSNGSASPIPYNVIRIFITQPDESSILDNYDQWLEMLLVHEYLHIVHLDMVRAGPAAFRKVFGRIKSINSVHPNFMIEGLAVYFETIASDNGRGRNSDVEMLLRMAILEDNFQPLDRWTTLSYTDWPGGYYSYNFGGRLHLYVVNKYGHHFDEVHRLHSGQIIPWRYNHNMRQAFGKTWPELYDEFKKDLEVEFARVKEDLETQGLTETTQLTDTGFRTDTPRFSPDGLYLLYSEGTPDHKPRIMRRDMSTGKETLLFERETGGGYSWSPLGRQIIYSQEELYKNDFLYRDLYLYDRFRKKKFRLTEGARALDPVFYPDRSGILFVHNHHSTSDLAKYVLATGKIELLTHNPPLGPQYSSPRFSPDGKTIAVSARIGDNRDIYLVDVATLEFTRITFDPNRDRSPAFSPAGDLLYFSSDRTGISNIFAFDLTAGEIYQVSNVLGGAFEPEPSPTGQTLAFTGYSSKGFDIHLMKLERGAWTPAPYRILQESELGDAALDRIEQEAVDPPIKESRYQPWRTLWPRWWFPAIGASGEDLMLGVMTSGQDVLREHGWQAAAYYLTKSRFVSYSVGYSNHQLYPTFSLGHSLSLADYGEIIKEGDQKKRYKERRFTGLASMSLSLIQRLSYSLNSSFSYRIQWRDELVDIPADQDNPPDTGLFSGPSASLSFSNTERYGYSISPEWGGNYSASVQVDDEIFGSDWDVRTYTGRLSQFFGIPKIHHVFALMFAGGAADGDVLRQRAFRLGGFSGFYPFNKPESGSFHLRGYESGAFSGQRVATGTFEYRFPIWRIERGISTLPLFFRTFSGLAFADAGNAWDDAWKYRNWSDQLHYSVGAELKLDMLFSFGLPIHLETGLAQGLTEPGILAWFVSLGAFF